MMNEYLDDDLDKNKPKLTPRKSMEFTEKKFDIEITTPQCTPPQSPKPPPQIQNQTKDEEEKNEFNFYELIQDETESILDVSLDDTEIQFEDNVTNSKSILIPPTPKETPNPTPEPPETPSLSEVTPPQPPQPRPISPQQPRQPSPPPQKILKSSSVQCDPEPVPIQKIHNQPLIESKSESELTDSSSDFSESSTTLETEKIDSETSESYFSDGAWLMSKSEGEIIRHNHNDYVNLDLQLATKGMIMNPRKNSDITQSEGEIKLDKLNSDQLKAYSGKRARPGVNLIQKERELGEKSDGEVEEKTNINKINESLKVKSKSKKIVSLSVSPEKGNKNKIQIKPLVNEHEVKDSNDFERKIFSSTPDTSLLISNNNNNRNDKFLGSQILMDSYDMQLSSNNKFGRINMRDSVFISTDFNTTKMEDEDNDDTLNNTSDLDDK
ncbi:unnamed protein product [Brachionus calyciflorus]|uniref:Uncharacterized protein n=1 Tax=Brachionus calyciflorus TaxID=104777 RepID=A0A813VQW6_9BILA|nr:unnamed protein product [Brachionus calyciflorus]